MDDGVLERARSGDDDAFARLVAPHRRELLTHCYRSLGSMLDAEDVLQEVLLSAWRALDTFDGRSLRAWLYRIATNKCLNHHRDASRRPKSAPRPGSDVVASGVVGADDPWWLEPIPDGMLEPADRGPEARYDDRESIALSFVAGLQHLPPRQRAVLVLRDVLGFPAAEVAGILDTSATSVNSALIRARAGFRPDRTPERVARPRSVDEAAVVDRFVDAFERGDLAAVVDVLTADARLSMPPEPIRCDGPDAVAAYLRWRGFWGPGVDVRRVRANLQPALVYSLPGAAGGTGDGVGPNGLMVLTVVDDRISTVTRFGGAEILKRFAT